MWTRRGRHRGHFRGDGSRDSEIELDRLGYQLLLVFWSVVVWDGGVVWALVDFVYAYVGV